MTWSDPGVTRHRSSRRARAERRVGGRGGGSAWSAKRPVGGGLWCLPFGEKTFGDTARRAHAHARSVQPPLARAYRRPACLPASVQSASSRAVSLQLRSSVNDPMHDGCAYAIGGSEGSGRACAGSAIASRSYLEQRGGGGGGGGGWHCGGGSEGVPKEEEEEDGVMMASRHSRQ